jgi:hypothetical protein
VEIGKDNYPLVYNHWEKLSESLKRGILEWIFNAKQEKKRIMDTVDPTAKYIKANQYNN